MASLIYYGGVIEYSESCVVGTTKNGHAYEEDLLDKARKNTDYRKVLQTVPCSFQVVLMSLEHGESIPMEIHPSTTQFILVVKGNEDARATVSKENPKTHVKHKLKKHGTSLTIFPGIRHEIRNNSKTETLKLISIYAPPEHDEKLIQKRQPPQKKIETEKVVAKEISTTAKEEKKKKKEEEKKEAPIKAGARILFNGNDNRYFLGSGIDNEKGAFYIYDRKKYKNLDCGHSYASINHYLQLQPILEKNGVSHLCPKCGH